MESASCNSTGFNMNQESYWYPYHPRFIPVVRFTSITCALVTLAQMYYTTILDHGVMLVFAVLVIKESFTAKPELRTMDSAIMQRNKRAGIICAISLGCFFCFWHLFGINILHQWYWSR